MVENFINILLEIVNKFGYIGIFGAAALEYACFPVSSEILLPFIGYCCTAGKLNVFITIISATAGGAVGCSFCYALGKYFWGFIERFVLRHFKSTLEPIEKAKRFVDKYGSVSVFIGRIFPLIRTYISFPAGMAKMKYSYFILFSTLGALVWNTVLIYIGYFLGEYWQQTTYFLKSNIALIVLLLCAVIYIIVFCRIRHNSK